MVNYANTTESASSAKIQTQCKNLIDYLDERGAEEKPSKCQKKQIDKRTN